MSTQFNPEPAEGSAVRELQRTGAVNKRLYGTPDAVDNPGPASASAAE